MRMALTAPYNRYIKFM